MSEEKTVKISFSVDELQGKSEEEIKKDDCWQVGKRRKKIVLWLFDEFGREERWLIFTVRQFSSVFAKLVKKNLLAFCRHDGAKIVMRKKAKNYQNYLIMRWKILKQKTFQMRVDETELNELKELALSKKMTVAQYIRFCVEQDKKMSRPLSKSSMENLLLMLQEETRLIYKQRKEDENAVEQRSVEKC